VELMGNQQLSKEMGQNYRLVFGEHPVWNQSYRPELAKISAKKTSPGRKAWLMQSMTCRIYRKVLFFIDIRISSLADFRFYA
jgi:hypothetical protein